MSSAILLTQLRDLGLWPAEEPVQRQILELSEQFSDGRLLARELIQRDLLTPYQANQLLTGKGAPLVVGPYQVLGRLGEGGMGQVYKARHRQLRHLVALKIIRPERVRHALVVARFAREIQAASTLNHPNVVRGYDADQSAAGYYFAMEFIEGIDLSRLVKQQGPRPVAQACALIQRAALGLQHIHEHGMIHRDIKPGNLMIELRHTDGATRNQVKLLDLGLARLNEDPSQEGPQRPGLTHVGTLMAPDFMAPEQARDAREADIRSDIYSLGCTFYFALTGRPPFPGGTVVQKVMHHQLDEPPRVEQLRLEVPTELAQIVRRMMAKQPADRYQTPAEVAAVLAGFAVDAPAVQAQAIAPLPEAFDPFELLTPEPPRRSARNWPRVALLAVMAGGTGILILLALWLRSLSQ